MNRTGKYIAGGFQDTEKQKELNDRQWKWLLSGLVFILAAWKSPWWLFLLFLVWG